MTDQLLPCPFCGRLPAIHPKDPAKQGGGWAVVRCENSKCPAKPAVEYYGDRSPKAHATKRWNRSLDRHQRRS